MIPSYRSLHNKISKESSTRVLTRFDFVRIHHRTFHATAKREIIPLIGLAVVAIVGRYSYRALRRMEEEWEDYEEALKEYNAQNPGNIVRTGTGGASTAAKLIALPILGISTGSANTRISYLPTNATEPYIVENREGARRTPSFVLFENNSNVVPAAIGKMAKSKRYERSTQPSLSQVISPTTSLLQGKNVAQAQRAYQVLVRDLGLNALEKVLGASTSSSSGAPLFGSANGLYPVQPVITYPPTFKDSTVDQFVDAMDALTDSSTGIQYVSEPVAATVAANHFKLFAKASSTGAPTDGPILVMDIGGEGLSTCLVSPKNESILYHSQYPGMGVDTLVTAIVNVLVRDFYKISSSSTTNKDLKDIVQGDGTALQRLYDAAEDTLWELSSSKPGHRSQISIPYLSMDFQTRQPRHLNVGISSNLVEDELTHMLVNQLVKDKGNGEDVSSIQRRAALSSFIAQPSSISDIVSSVVTKVLEETNETPFKLRGVLLCGDGGRSPIYQSSVKKGLARVAGEQYTSDRLVIPSVEQVEELVVLGAALMGRRPGDQ